MVGADGREIVRIPGSANTFAVADQASGGSKIISSATSSAAQQQILLTTTSTIASNVVSTAPNVPSLIAAAQETAQGNFLHQLWVGSFIRPMFLSVTHKIY